MSTRRRLVRPTGPLADRKREEDELVALIRDWKMAGPSTVTLLARRILDAGYKRRVVVDDALIHLLLSGWFEHDHERMVCYDHTGRCCPADDAHDMVASEALMHRARSALTAALRTDR